MSRLIDADKLIEWINEQREQVTKKQVSGTDGSIFTREALVTMQRCISTFENKINNQPTAFDKEKVVEQLDNVLQDLNVIEILSQFDPDSTIQTSLDRFLNAVRNEVLNIVKKGGVE